MTEIYGRLVWEETHERTKNEDDRPTQRDGVGAARARRGKARAAHYQEKSALLLFGGITAKGRRPACEVKEKFHKLPTKKEGRRSDGRRRRYLPPPPPLLSPFKWQ